MPSLSLPAQSLKANAAALARDDNSRGESRMPACTAALTTEVEAWVAARNHAGASVKWMLGIEQARTKLGHAYPSRNNAARDVAA